MKCWRSLLLVAASAGTYGSALAATNGLDGSFGSGGIALLGPTPSSALKFNIIRAISADDQGRILIGGIFFETSDPSGAHDLAAVGRLLSSGNWDVSFGDHGIYVLPYGATAAPYGGSIDNIAALPGGELLLSGTSFQQYFGRIGPKNSCILLVKLTATGALDPTFATDHSGTECFDFAPQGDAWIQYHPNTIAARADGSFYASTFSTNLFVDPSTILGAVARFDAFGVLDPGFGNGGIVESEISFFQLNLMPSGELLGAEAASQVGATMITQTGALDLNYGTEGVAFFNPQQGQPGSQPATIRIDPQQRLVAGMNFFNAGTGYSYGLVRLDALGQPDATFNGSSQQPGAPGVAMPYVSGDGDNDFLIDVEPLSDGHILVVGGSGFAAGGDGVSNIAFLRLNSDSSYDTSFGDTAHPGWSSINIGGAADSVAYTQAVSLDTSSRVITGINVTDANGHYCAAVLRIVPDRLLEARFDMPPAMPTCPQ